MRKDVNDMFEIKGKVTTAICYAKVIEDEAIEQIRRMCDYDLTRGSKVRIMPDVHAGKGCTIGTTMTITDKICPNIVGVDIGCGMYTVKLQDQAIDFEKIDEACHYIPSGMNVWEGRMERFDLTQLKCYRSLKDAVSGLNGKCSGCFRFLYCYFITFFVFMQISFDIFFIFYNTIYQAAVKFVKASIMKQ